MTAKVLNSLVPSVPLANNLDPCKMLLNTAGGSGSALFLFRNFDLKEKMRWKKKHTKHSINWKLTGIITKYCGFKSLIVQYLVIL